jgi:hypothetical protein
MERTEMTCPVFLKLNTKWVRELLSNESRLTINNELILNLKLWKKSTATHKAAHTKMPLANTRKIPYRYQSMWFGIKIKVSKGE